jgi:hypothetical protein
MSALDDAYDEVCRESVLTRCKTCLLLQQLPDDLAASLSRMLDEGRPHKTISKALARLDHHVSYEAISNHRTNGHSNVRPR